MNQRRYRRVALGGTFDTLHRGHKLLIDTAFELGDRVLLGLTTDQMLRAHPKDHAIASYATRSAELVAYLRDREYLNRAEILPLADPYGPTLRDEALEALIVSRDTAPRAAEVNRLRVAQGLTPLDIVIAATVLDADGLPISTSRILQEKITRNGRRRGTKRSAHR